MDYIKVASYTPPDENGGGEKIVREFYGQGMIFKSDEAFYDTEHPDRVCHIPELSDTKYTRNSSLLEDWFRNGELGACKECGKIFNCYGKTKCPYCGAKYEGKFGEEKEAEDHGEK